MRFTRAAQAGYEAEEAGASWSLIMTAAQAVLTGAIFLLSIRRGEGGLSPRPRITRGRR